MTALALIPILLALGGAIDYARIMALRTRFQQATDSAALAALASLNDDPALKQKLSSLASNISIFEESSKMQPAVDYQAVARNYIEQNFNSDKSFTVTTTTTANWANGTMTVNSKTSAPTFLLGLAGLDRIDLSANATAAVGAGGEAQEIAIAFDTTFSMNFKGRKEAAIAAAKDFIHKVMNYPSGMPNPNVRVALVPFNDYVNVGSRVFYTSFQQGMRFGLGLSWLTSTDDIVQKFPEVCWEAKTTTNSIEKTICTPYTGTCTSNNCSPVPATCWADGESYECTSQKCEPVSYACTQQSCKGTGQFDTTTTTTPAGCTPAYEIRTKWTGCVGSRDNVSDEIDLADANNKVSAVFSVGCPQIPIIFLSQNINIQLPSYNEEGAIIPTNWISTSGENGLIKALDKMTFEGTTYIAPGLLWAWRVVSPETPFAGWYDTGKDQVDMTDVDTSNFWDQITVCGQKFAPGSFANRFATKGFVSLYNIGSTNIPGCPYKYVKKSIVLMTDGLSTKSASYDDMGRHEKTDRAAANAKLANICKNIKAAGIKVYTISFMVNDSDTLATLTGCASDASTYFDAGNTASLANAFQTIGNNFTRLRLIK